MSFTLTSPFASISGEAIESLVECGDSGANPDLSNDEVILDEFAECSSSYELEDLDPLSALEKYCRSEMPAQRLAYTAGIGAAVGTLEPSAVSGSLVSLLKELLGDVYADVRLTALQQVVPVARRLREPGTTYQSDIETLWDVVQPVLLDADVENQEAAGHVLAELTHLVAWGNSVVAGQKLVWAVQRLQRLPQELLAEGALAALRLITEVVVPRPGSSLCFDAIQDFVVSIFKDMVSYERNADVRQAAALLLPRFVRHMPAAVRATLLPGLLKTLSSDTHWNVRAEVPDLLINLLAVTQHPVGQTSGQTNGLASSRSLSEMFERSGGDAVEQQQLQQQQGSGDVSGHTAAAVGSAAVAVGAAAVDGFTQEERRVICDVADKLCRDASHLVKVPALASLGQLLPLLPAADAAAAKPNLLSLYASTAKPPVAIGGVRVPAQLSAPRLSGRVIAQRQRRQQQQRRPGKAQQQQQQRVCTLNTNEVQDDSSIQHSTRGPKALRSPFATVAAVEQASSASNSSLGFAAGAADIVNDTAAAAAASAAAAAAAASGAGPAAAASVADMAGAAGVDPALLADDFDFTISNNVAGAPDIAETLDKPAATASDKSLGPAAAAVAHVAGAAGVDPHLLESDLEGDHTAADADKLVMAVAPAAKAAAVDTMKVQQELQQQQQQESTTPAVHVATRGTAAAELPLACAFHIGKVTRHVGSHCWPIIQPAFLSLAAAAVAGDADIAAALLLSFSDLAAALGPASTRAVLVPVILELLHNQLEQLAPVLSVMLYDVTAALPSDLRICLLQLLPSLAIQPDREVAGDWRARVAVAQQLPAVAMVLTAPQVAYCVWPLLLTLAKDPVHAVRSAAAVQVGPLLMQLPDRELPPEESAATDAAAADAADAAEEAADAADAAEEAADAADAAEEAADAADAAEEAADAADAAEEAADAADAAEEAADAADAAEEAADAATAAQGQAAAAAAACSKSAVASESSAALAAGVAAAAASSETSAGLETPTAAEAEADILAAANTVEAAVVAAAAAATAADDNGQLLTASWREQQEELQQQQQQRSPAAVIEDQHSAVEEQQQQPRQQRRSRLGKMKRGLLHGLQQLHQQLQDGIQQGVDLVKESGGLQRALTEVDSQLQWLQQHPTGSVLHSIGQKISAAAAAAGGNPASASSNGNAYFSLGQLEGRLNSSDIIESVIDPCKYLPTPAWPALAVDLAALAKGGSSTERQAFVVAAGSILAAHKRRAQLQQQQHQTGSANEDSYLTISTVAVQASAAGQQQQQELQSMELDHLLQELQELAGDPVPGVRCGVAAVAGKLLSVSQAADSSSNGAATAKEDSDRRARLAGKWEPSVAATAATTGLRLKARPAQPDTTSGTAVAAPPPNTLALTPQVTDVLSPEGAEVAGTPDSITGRTNLAAAGDGTAASSPAAQEEQAQAVVQQGVAAADPNNTADAAAMAAVTVAAGLAEPAAGAKVLQDKQQEDFVAGAESSAAHAIDADPAEGTVVSSTAPASSTPADGTAEAAAAALVDVDVPGLPAGAAAVLQQCLQKLQRDPCASVASMAAGLGVSADSAANGSAS